MKQIQTLVKVFVACGIALALVSNAVAQEVKQISAKVVRVKGDARYSTDGKSWRSLMVGTLLGGGAVVQTAASSTVDIVLDESESPGPSPVMGNTLVYQPVAQQNIVRVWEDSVLGIDKLTKTETGVDVVTETQLDLRAGRIFGTVKKLSATSKYEIKIPNGVCGIRGTVYMITAFGVVDVLKGAVVLAFVKEDGTVLTHDVPAGYEYDARTGQLIPLPVPTQGTLDEFSNEILPISTQQAPVTVPGPEPYVSPTVGLKTTTVE